MDYPIKFGYFGEYVYIIHARAIRRVIGAGQLET